jgi:RND family efflux transporter MFP subunit
MRKVSKFIVFLQIYHIFIIFVPYSQNKCTQIHGGSGMKRLSGKTAFKVMTAAAALGLVGSLLSGCGSAAKTGGNQGRNQAQRTMPVVTETVKMADVGGSQIFMGSVAPEYTTNVSSKVTGRVTDLLVKVGDKVTEGQALAKIDTSTLEQQIATSYNSLTISQAQYQKALTDQANSLSSAENALAMQKLQYAKSQNDQQNAIASAKMSVELSKTALEKAKRDQQNSVNSARQSLASAQAQLAKAINDANNSVANAQNSLNTAQDSLNSTQTSVDNSSQSLQQIYDQAKQAYSDAADVNTVNPTAANKKAMDDAFSKFKAAELTLNQSLQGTDPKVVSAQNAVNKAQADLTSALNSQTVQIQQEALNKSLQDLANAQAASTDTQELQLNQSQMSLSNTIATQEINANTSKQQLTQAEQALKNAQNSESLKISEAQLKQAETNYNNLLQQLQDATVVSPVEGVVTALGTPIGQNATGQSVIATIAAIDPLVVSVGVSESKINQFTVGMAMVVHIPTLDKTFDGTVKQVRPTLDATTKSYGVDITISDPKHQVLPGMFAETSLKSEGRKAIMVPADAVLNQPSGNASFVVVDGKAKKVSVTIGAVSSTTFEITKGLKEGDKLVVQGQELLSNNVAVEEVDPNAPPSQGQGGQRQQGQGQQGQQGQANQGQQNRPAANGANGAGGAGAAGNNTQGAAPRAGAGQ